MLRPKPGPKHLACKRPITNTDDLKSFLQSYNIFYKTTTVMSALWPYRRVIVNPSGYHGEFHNRYKEFTSLIFLGKEENDALKLMLCLVEQNIS